MRGRLCCAIGDSPPEIRLLKTPKGHFVSLQINKCCYGLHVWSMCWYISCAWHHLSFTTPIKELETAVKAFPYPLMNGFGLRCGFRVIVNK